MSKPIQLIMRPHASLLAQCGRAFFRLGMAGLMAALPVLQAVAEPSPEAPAKPAKPAEAGRNVDEAESHNKRVVEEVRRAMASPSRQMQFGKMTVEAGKLGGHGRLKIDAGPVKMEFPFKNAGTEAVRILEVKPDFTTGVTAALKDGKMEYAPGESGVLLVTYDPAKETIPWYLKEVRLVCEGDVGQIHPSVQFTIPQHK